MSDQLPVDTIACVYCGALLSAKWDGYRQQHERWHGAVAAVNEDLNNLTHLMDTNNEMLRRFVETDS